MQQYSDITIMIRFGGLRNKFGGYLSHFSIIIRGLSVVGYANTEFWKDLKHWVYASERLLKRGPFLGNKKIME